MLKEKKTEMLRVACIILLMFDYVLCDYSLFALPDFSLLVVYFSAG
jgi:hypothetical protein